MLSRIVLPAGAALLLLAPCHAQKAQTSPKPADEAAAAVARLSTADASSLLTRIKALDSPASRVYLYSRVASWLSQDAGADQDVRRVALEAASAGVSDLHRHETEVPPAPAAMLHARLLAVAAKLDPQKAEELKRSFPLRREAEETDADKANKAFYSALSKLANPETAAQGAEAAAALIESGALPASVLQGELTRLEQAKSPALPRLLASALALEERKPGALPLQTMFFLSYVYLKEGTPAPLQARFLAATLRGTRLGPAELKGNPAALNWAISLLQQTLPAMQKLTPDLYAEASARLASLSPAASPEAAAFERVKGSDDPLAQLLSEADAAKDDGLKGELLASAAREAKRQGKLRLAAELMVAAEDDRRTPSESHVSRDEFLTGVVQDSLTQKDDETARFAASKIKSPVEQAAALRLVARHHAKADDFQTASRTLGEAQKALEGAADGRDSVSAYLQLAADFSEVDAARAPEAVREAARIAGRLKPAHDAKAGEFSWRLFPVADAAIRTFQTLARSDREGALGLANTMQPKELAVAASLGVLSSTPK